MKRKYIIPELHMQQVQTNGMLALSLTGGTANDSDALVKDNAWDIFGNDSFEDEAED